MAVVFHIVRSLGTDRDESCKRIKVFVKPWQDKGAKVEYLIPGEEKHRLLQTHAFLAKAFGKNRRRTYKPELIVTVDEKVIWAGGNPTERQLKYLRSWFLDQMSWPEAQSENVA